jgi:hypothetical protein
MLGAAIPGQFIIAQPTTDGTVPSPTPPAATGNPGDGPNRWLRWGRAFMWHHWHFPSGS